MSVILYWKWLEAPLPNMPRRCVTTAVMVSVGSHQPVRPPRQPLINVRSEYEVEVVGHETEGHYIQRDPLGRPNCQLEKGSIVHLVMKDRCAGVTAIDYVITNTRRC